MTTKVIELKDTDGNILLPHAYSASHDNNGDAFSSVYATIQTVNTKADDNSVVHLSGNEVITGIKTINVPTAGTNLIFKSNLIDTSTTPEENIYHHIDYRDKNDNLLARIFECRDIYGANVLALQTWNGSTQHWIGVNSSGYGVAPTPSDASDNSQKIATTAWVNNHLLVDENVVRTTGSQSISGRKSFAQGINLYNESVIKGTNPETVRYWALLANDSTDNSDNWKSTRLGALEWSLNENGILAGTLYGYKNEQDSQDNSYISVVYDSNTSKAYTRCTASDVINSIVTTTGINKVTNGYVRLGNGMIIQWGSASAAPYSGSSTITLPLAMNNTNYSIVVSPVDSTDNYLRSVFVRSKTTTNFVARGSFNGTSAATVTFNFVVIGYN